MNNLANVNNQNMVRKPTNEMKNVLNIPSIRQLFENSLNKKSGAFISSLIDLYGGDSYLQNCDPKDVAMEALKAATLDLPINKNLGFAYVVPFKNKGKLTPTFIIGYKGLIQLAMRSGQYKALNTGAIYEGMQIKENYLEGTIEVTGKPNSNKVVGYFAYFKLLNGFEKAVYMTKEEVEAYGRKYSKSYNAGPWQTEFDSQAKKTVMRRLLSKYGVLSTEMQNVMTSEEDMEIKADVSENNATLEVPEYVEVEGEFIDSETGEIIDDVEAPF